MQLLHNTRTKTYTFRTYVRWLTLRRRPARPSHGRAVPLHQRQVILGLRFLGSLYELPEYLPRGFHVSFGAVGGWLRNFEVRCDFPQAIAWDEQVLSSVG